MRLVLLFSLSLLIYSPGCPSIHYAATQFSGPSKEYLAKIKEPVFVEIERDDSPLGGPISLVVYDGDKEIGRLGPSGSFKWKREAGLLSLKLSGTVGERALLIGKIKNVCFEDYQQSGDTHRFRCGVRVASSKTTSADDIDIWLEPQQQIVSQDVLSKRAANSALKGIIYDDWKVHHLTLWRIPVKLGLTVEESDRSYESKEKECVASINDSEGGFVIENLLAGRYLLKGQCNRKKPLTKSEKIEIVRAYMGEDYLLSLGTIARFTTNNGIVFQEDDQGNWHSSIFTNQAQVKEIFYIPDNVQLNKQLPAIGIYSAIKK